MKEEFYPYIDHAAAQRNIPVAIWVGTADPYFSLELVHATRDAINGRGLHADVFEMKGHDHDYYSVAGDLNPKIWEFLKATSLFAQPEWESYKRR